MNTPAMLLLALTVTVPVALLAAVPLVARPLRLLPWAALPGLATALIAPAGTTLHVPVLLIGLTFEIDQTAKAFLGFGALLWLLAGIYASAYLERARNRGSFAIFWLLTLAGTLGTFVAGDLVSFYLAFSMMSLSAYGLVIHERTDAARRAGRIYIALAVIGESALIASFMVVATGATSLGFADVRQALADAPDAHWVLAGLVVGFGIKAGLVPLHGWLPLAHPQAPTPASAVLSGVIVKAGILGLIRLLPDQGVWPEWSALQVVVGLVTAGYGAIVGLTQRDAKAVLAYSTLSQMGLVVSVLGISLGLHERSAHADAVTLYVLHHGLAKGALFLGVGVMAAIATRWRRPVLAALALTALAIAGLPLTGGALAKLAIKAPLGDDLAATLVTLSAVTTALLMLHFLRVVAGSSASAHRPAPAMIWSWATATAAAFGATWYTFEGLVHAPPSAVFALQNLWGGAWPILLAAAVAAVLIRTTRQLPGLPQGDVVVLAERLGASLRQVGSVRFRALPRLPMRLNEFLRDWVPGRFESIERSLRAWPVAGFFITLVVLALVLSLAPGTSPPG
ncbi:MAG: NADH dehydrogenase [Pseudomonadales bacterium]|nr:NADH dehydrogenase [Pseudomonadales bacterium]